MLTLFYAHSFVIISHSLFTFFTFFTFSLLSSLFTGVREALEVLCAASEFERDDVCRVRRGEQRHIRESMGCTCMKDQKDSSLIVLFTTME